MDVFEKVSGFFKKKDVDIDTNVCKLHYRITAALFFASSLAGLTNHYFGEPISCNFNDKDINPDLAKDYCWIHGSNYFPDVYNGHIRCAVDPMGRKGQDVSDTSYYQWVTVVLFLQAVLCIFPYKIWKLNEGGLISSFQTNGVSMPQMDEDELNFSSNAQAMSRHYLNLRGRYKEYFIKFFLLEITFLVLSWGHFFFIDWFLNGQFLGYGSSAVQYYGLSLEERVNYANPLCTTFPTEVSCTIPFVGPSGYEASLNSLCVLSQNIVNEKMYVLIWFWLVFLIVISSLNFVVRLAYIAIPSYRAAFVSQKVSSYQSRETKHLVTNRLKPHDAFILGQLGKNINPGLFDELVHHILRSLETLGDDEEKVLVTPTPC
eukprot:TRINITY_DN3961_c0_g1_i1.p1 TRINITY_DN3961_c0_g1~~TRINITY_DN3961_c0_g1_i1.p1  ORF type:complete len:374 (+),score=95.67 TRINITY_DN3961_c0_g1_i1:76-1197(+)